MTCSSIRISRRCDTTTIYVHRILQLGIRVMMMTAKLEDIFNFKLVNVYVAQIIKLAELKSAIFYFYFFVLIYESESL